jgi:aspartyl-tRNA synthetase
MISRRLLKPQVFKDLLKCNQFSVGTNQSKAQFDLAQKLKRTHYCGELGTENEGQAITVCGWLQTKRYSNFIILRDIQGTLQVCLDKDFIEANPRFSVDNLTNESVLSVSGVVRKRPESMVNTQMKTGHIEVKALNIKVINIANEKLPFTISQHNRASEQVRMKYRYLDLRFSDMQHNLMMRSDFVNRCRQFLNENRFLDIETPTLFRRTPGK